jgi:hypothetical protein
MLAGRLSPVAWWRSVKGPKYEAVFDRHDPAPFAADMVRAITAATGAMVGAVGRRLGAG